jgi:predicted DNA-binding WGR domain protein
MRVMPSIEVRAEELAYIDAAANSDKFYRVFTIGAVAVVQYGRGGTAGTFKRTTFPTAELATAAAAKQAGAKFSKGYERIKSVTLLFETAPTDSDLDTAMNSAPAGAVASDSAVRQADARAAAAVRLNAVDVVTDPAVLAAVRAALTTTIGAASPESAASGTSAGAAAFPTAGAVRPMLAETAAPDQLESYLTNDQYVAQLKLDGDRFVVEVLDGVVQVFNRQGVPKTSNVAEAVLAPLRQLSEGRWVFDGEIIGRKLWLFDLLDAGGHLAPDAPFRLRHTALTTVLQSLNPDEASIGLLGYVAGTEAKRELLATARAENREGIIIRDAEAAYQPGRRSRGLLRLKFLRELDAHVVEVATSTGKQNAALAVYDDLGQAVAIGKVSTIGKGAVAVGDVVEVRFLYTVGDRLFQPRIVRVRTDKTGAECSARQLEGTRTNKVV